MSRIERSAIVRVGAKPMCDLVDDIAGYAARFPWCEGSAVLQRCDDGVVARLDVRMAGLRMSFTTRNRREGDHVIYLDLVDGPFTALGGAWRFDALAEDACKVSLGLDFELANRALAGALASGFRGLADRLVDDFVREGRRLHGR